MSGQNRKPAAGTLPHPWDGLEYEARILVLERAGVTQQVGAFHIAHMDYDAMPTNAMKKRVNEGLAAIATDDTERLTIAVKRAMNDYLEELQCRA